MIGSLQRRMIRTIATHDPTQETTMTRIQPNVDFNFINVLVRWIQTYYVHKLERYAANHQSIGVV